jgi:lysozyme family protein
MASFEDYRKTYARNWNKLTIRSERREEARNVGARIMEGKPHYLVIQERTKVPWWFTGLCHYRESTFDFETYLGNGEPLSRRTRLEPKGRGPFSSFEEGAVDAFKIKGWIGARDWGIERASYRLETFNGFGYHGKGVNSPYLYGGSILYGPPEAKAGKYTRDHYFDPNYVEKQLGTLVVLKALITLDESIKVEESPPDVVERDDLVVHGILWVQQSLNKLGARPRLEEDGINGPLTMALVRRFQKENDLEVDGLAGPQTIGEIARHLERLQANPPMPADATIDALRKALG